MFGLFDNPILWIRSAATKWSHNYWPTFLLFVLGTVWGLHFSIIKIVSQSGMSYTGVASLLTVGVATVMMGLALVRRKLPVVNRATLVYYIVCASLGYLVPFFISINVAKHLPASVLAIVVSTTPIWTILIAWLTRFETVQKRHFWGIFLGFLAACILLLPGATMGDAKAAWWVVPALCLPVCYAANHTYISRYWPRGSDAFQVAGGKEVAAALIALPIYLSSGDYITLADWSAGAWTIPTMIFCFLVGVFLYFEINRIAGPVFVSQANYVTVVAGIVFGWVFFDEHVTYGLALSFTLLIASLWLTRKAG